MLESLRASLATRRTQSVLLAGLFALGFALRWAWLSHRGDTDGDSYGHWGIACSLLAEPTRVDLHWVWPPAYHYWLLLLLRLGVTFGGVRILNALMASAVPVVVFYFCRSRRSLETVAWPSALLTFLSPLAFLSGTSAQQETLFGLLVLLAAYALERERERPVFAGLFLTVAVLVRYEALGAAGLLALQSLMTRAWPRLRQRLGAPAPWPSWVLPIAGLMGWALAHRLADGRWFAFLEELYRFTRAQRDGYRQPWLLAATWFPLRQPLHIWGPFVLLAPLAAHAKGSTDRAMAVPVGVWLFLLVSYLGRGVQANARYYVSLVPFGCLAMALGWRRLDGWLAQARTVAWRGAARWTLAVAMAVVSILILHGHLTRQWRIEDEWAIREAARADRLAQTARARVPAAPPE